MEIGKNCRIDYEQQWKHQSSEGSTINKNVVNPLLNLLYPLECENEHRQCQRLNKLIQTSRKTEKMKNSQSF